MRRTPVVTGGAGGIGGAIVRALTEAGHDVAVLDRTGEFAVDLGASGITVNCVAPGLTRTRFTEADLPEEAFQEVLLRQALPRSLVPDDVAGVVAFLASEAAGAITGQTLCADGGSVFN
jgi:pyridoxal 4-dehydrogenase